MWMFHSYLDVAFLALIFLKGGRADVGQERNRILASRNVYGTVSRCTNLFMMQIHDTLSLLE